MRTRIINPKLQKPWLLISCYEKVFDEYLEMSARLKAIHKRYGYRPQRTSWQWGVKADELKAKIKNASESMRDIDQMIHNFIVNNNQPVTKQNHAA